MHGRAAHARTRPLAGKLNRHEFARLVAKLHLHQHGAQAQVPAGPGPALRASFGAFDHKGDGTIATADLRAALVRAGLDTANRVAVAMFSELQEQGRQAVDFGAFQRMAHAIAAHTGAVAPAPPAAAVPPYGGNAANPYALPPTPSGGALAAAPPPPGYPPVQYPGSGAPAAASAKVSTTSAYYQQPLGGYPAPTSAAPVSSRAAGAPYNDPYAAYQASFGAAPYGGHPPPPPSAALPVAPPNAAAQQAEAKRLARKPHTPTKTKHIELSSTGGSGYSSAYALPAPTALQPRKL